MPQQPEQKQETVGEVVAAMRRYAELVEAENADISPELAQLLREYADRVERASEREREDMEARIREAWTEGYCTAPDKSAPGNAAAMRAALNAIVDIAEDAFGGPERHREASQGRALSLIIDAVRAALAAPARNCDRFATELDARLAWKRETHCTGDYRYWLFAPAEGGAE